MSLPPPQDYITEVQHPDTCFEDPDLKAGSPMPNLKMWGLPALSTGSYAIVFPIHCGTKIYAVRCFYKQSSANLQQRYQLISQHLASYPLPMFVKFIYLDRGIRVDRQFYPIVKMEWVQGESLHEYVGKCISNPHLLRQLASEWREVIESLRKAGIGHGDLQNGNVLISQGRIKLVDYDGIFLPALLGDPPREYGYPCFQHPKRSDSDYNENVDNFSASVIYLSLLGLAAEPKLWVDFCKDNPDKLLFDEKDFLSPGHTGIWKRLKRSPDTVVQGLTIALEDCCRGSVSAVPHLETILERIPTGPLIHQTPVTQPLPPQQVFLRAPVLPQPTPTPQPTWYSSYVGPSLPVSARPATIPPTRPTALSVPIGIAICALVILGYVSLLVPKPLGPKEAAQRTLRVVKIESVSSISFDNASWYRARYWNVTIRNDDSTQHSIVILFRWEEDSQLDVLGGKALHAYRETEYSFDVLPKSVKTYNVRVDDHFMWLITYYGGTNLRYEITKVDGVPVQ